MKRILFQLLRYGTVTVLSYLAIIVLMFFLVDLLSLYATFSYALTLTIVYIGVYLASSRWVFKVKAHSRSALKFTSIFFVFWALNLTLFYVLNEILGIHHLLSVTINLLLFGSLRFLINRNWVFREEDPKSEPGKEFIQKYESKPWLYQRFFINPFFKSLGSLIPSDIQSAHEFACGGGYSTERIRSFLKAKEFSASDIDPQLVKLAQERNPGVDISVQSIYEPRANEKSDLVIALEVLEHLDDYEAALAALESSTNKYLLLSVPREPIWRMLNMLRGKYWKDLGNTPGHINHWSRSAFLKLLNKRFDIVAVKNPLPWTIVLAKVKR